MTHKDDILNTFKLPIEETDYIVVDKDVLNDLELNNETNPYSLLFQDNTELGKIIQEKWKNYYSSDKKFLKSQQKIIKKLSKLSDDKKTSLNTSIINVNNYYQKWGEIKSLNNEDFLNKFDYISWSHLKNLNTYPLFLQAMTYYNIASPLINILLPVLLMIIPFFIIKLTMSEDISFELYKSLLLKQLSNHSIGAVIKSFCGEDGCVDINTKIYAAASFSIYLFTIYQNILSCIKFYKNTYFIQSYLYDTKEFIKHSSNIREIIESQSGNHNLSITDDMFTYLNILNNKINIHTDQFSIYNINNVGNMMHSFHTIFTDDYTNQTILYSFGFTGYISNLLGLVERFKDKSISLASIKSNKKTSMIKGYYPFYIGQDDIVSNDISLDKKIIITGPNASGKTTILKTIFINVLLTQQFGCGCYKKCTIMPYDKLFSYINIPDTSGRDSLFQAEARRCLDIINYLRENKEKSKTLCIFDELFSGTNPDEAQKSAISLLKYFKNYNVDLLLTTHFDDIKLFTDKKYSQKHMIVSNDKYTYKLGNGYSTINGAIRVLKDMNYPNEIIDMI